MYRLSLQNINNRRTQKKIRSIKRTKDKSDLELTNNQKI